MTQNTHKEKNAENITQFVPENLPPLWQPVGDNDLDLDSESDTIDTAYKDNPGYRPFRNKIESETNFKQYMFVSLEKWNGEITRIEDGRIFARISNMKGGINEEADFPLSDVSEDDRSLVREGATFIFSIGRQMSPGGQITRCPRMYFRRIPIWTSDEVLKAHDKAEALLKKISAE